MIHDSISLIEGSSFVNLCLDAGTAFPDSASEGELFYRSDLKTIYFFNGTGWSQVGPLSTTDLDEGSNLYFTNERARAAISVTGSGGTYDSATGVLTLTGGGGGASLSANNVFTGANTFSNASLTIGTTGGSNRIYSDFSSNGAARTYFQTSVSNGATNLGVIPNGTGTESRLSAFNATNVSSRQLIELIAGSTAVTINSANTGKTNLPIVFSFGGTEAARILNTGAVSFGSSGTATGAAGQFLVSSGSTAAPTWKTFSEVLNPVTSITSTATTTLNCASFNTFNVTLATDITTLAFSNVPTGSQYTMTLILAQGASGGRAVTWPVSIKWPGGAAPVNTLTGGRFDIYNLMTIDGGTTWSGTVVGMNFV